MHTDVTNLEFLRKSAGAPNYALLIVDLYSSKVDVYPMRSSKQIQKKISRIKEKIGTQSCIIVNEFQKVKIKDLNDKFNGAFFTTSLRGEKVFAAEQEIRELKSRISKLRATSDKKKPKYQRRLSLNNLVKI